MCSSHNVHLSNQKMKCSTGIALRCEMFLKGSGYGRDICKKVQNFQFLGHNVLIDMLELLAQRR